MWKTIPRISSETRTFVLNSKLYLEFSEFPKNLQLDFFPTTEVEYRNDYVIEQPWKVVSMYGYSEIDFKKKYAIVDNRILINEIDSKIIEDVCYVNKLFENARKTWYEHERETNPAFTLCKIHKFNREVHVDKDSQKLLKSSVAQKMDLFEITSSLSRRSVSNRIYVLFHRRYIIDYAKDLRQEQLLDALNFIHKIKLSDITTKFKKA